MAIARFLDRMRLALRASGLWLRSATLQNLIPSSPWIALPRPPPWRNPRKGRDQILQRRGALVQKPEGPITYDLKILLSPSGNYASARRWEGRRRVFDGLSALEGEGEVFDVYEY